MNKEVVSDSMDINSFIFYEDVPYILPASCLFWKISEPDENW